MSDGQDPWDSLYDEIGDWLRDIGHDDVASDFPFVVAIAGLLNVAFTRGVTKGKNMVQIRYGLWPHVLDNLVDVMHTWWKEEDGG